MTTHVGTAANQKNPIFMKRQIILSLVFAFFFFVNLQAQEASTKRVIQADEVENLRMGEAAEFQKLLRRFETAYKEGDHSSVVDLKQDLVASMQKRVDLLVDEKSNEEEHLQEMKAQKEILAAVKEYDYSTMKRENKSSMDQIKLLQRFALLMEKNFVTQ